MKLDQLPSTGKIVIAHPNREAGAVRLAEQEGCDYMLRRMVADEARAFLLDMDEMQSRWEAL